MNLCIYDVSIYYVVYVCLCIVLDIWCMGMRVHHSDVYMSVNVHSCTCHTAHHLVLR